MRIEATRLAASVRLQHVAAFHTSTTDLVAQALPLVTAALSRAEPVVLAVGARTERALYDAVGGATGFVTLDAPEGAVRRSGQTVAMRRARRLRELTASGPITVLAEHDSALDGVDGRYWTELDAAQNVALADLPICLVCFFPELALYLEVLDGARRNHPQLLVAGELRHNHEHRRPDDVLAATPAPVPPLLGPPDVIISYTGWQLHDVRRAIEQLLTRIPTFAPSRVEDIVLAVNEVATNAVEHGRSEARIALWAGPDALVCEVHDGGVLTDPLPGLRAPHPAQPRGRGIWIARQLSDVLHLWSDGSGTHVRLLAGP